MKLGLTAAALLLTLTACGGDSEDSEAAPTPAPSQASASTTPTEEVSEAPSEEEALEEAYRTYVDAFLTGDAATAYPLLSERCREANALSEFATISESAAELYGPVDYTIENVTVDGDTGKVEASYAVEALNEDGGSTWVLEGGEWHTDRCG